MGWLKKYFLNWPAPVYVLLLAAFPVLYLYAYNVSQMSFGEAALPLGLCLAGGMVLWVLLTLILRNARKAGIAVAIFILFFFTYGRLYEVMENSGVFVPKHVYLLPVSLLIWGGCVYFIRRARRDFRTTTTVLNVVAVALIAINIFNIASYEINLASRDAGTPQESPAQTTGSVAELSVLPDIYFIILDEYAHPDTMKEWYDYDNSEFINSLEDKGFSIASQSKTRSPQTPQCLAQVLNMEYLTPGWEYSPEVDRYIERGTHRWFYPSLIWNDVTFRKIAYNEVADFLRARGYKYITFVSSARWGDYMKDSSDLYFNYFANDFKNADPLWISESQYFETAATPWISAFQETLWQTTMLRLFYYDMVGGEHEIAHRSRTLYTMEHMKILPEEQGPKFIFTRLVCPHSPLIFGPNGEYISRENYKNFADKKFFRDQYIFITKEIEKVVDALLEKSETPPIIILQADHGIRPKAPGIVIGPDEWQKILNAMYLPGMNYSEISDSISPVNTFRLIFNHYFGANYTLLEND
jgi:hypothetical protein